MGSLGGGHYTAVVRNLEDGRWFACDDSRVALVDPALAVSPNAYVLFYQRRGRAKWAGLLSDETSHESL